MSSYYNVGDHKVQCDICGRQKKYSQCRKTWDGFLACRDRCWYPKHPNDYPRRIIPDGYPVQDPRPKNVVYVPVAGTTNWEDPDLTWETVLWRWDDDSSNDLNYIW